MEDSYIIEEFQKKHHKIKDINSFLDGMKFCRELLIECEGRECLDLLNFLDYYRYS